MMNIIELPFPSSRKLKRCFRLAGLLFLLLPLRAFADAPTPDNARKQISVAVHLQASEVIRSEARSRRWPDYSAKMNLFIPEEASRLPLCGKTLSASLPEGERPDFSRLRFEVRCDEQPGWRIAVTARPEIILPVVVARREMARGHVVTPADIAIKKLDISGARGRYMLHPDKVTGLTVKRRIREQQPLTLSQLESPVLVNRGQQVLMIAEHNGVQAQTVGEALKKGRKGEIIKVKNASSQQIVSAVVADTGIVRMVFAKGR